MKPLRALAADEARGLRGLLFDLDDTLLTHGVLERGAYGALWDLRDAGLRLVAVTGRPSGWGEVIARQWPIDGAVTENGAAHVVREGKGVKVVLDGDASARDAMATRLAALGDDVRRAFPEIALADDVHARRTDLAWDIGERVAVPREEVQRLAAFVVARGARTTRSSVHLHATFDRDDKASGVVRFLATRFGEDPGAALGRYGFVGDSRNDAACFAAFRSTFGVANVRAHVSGLSVPPRYVATAAQGEGFAELARTLLALRA